jgi:hypothetical protein
MVREQIDRATPELYSSNLAPAYVPSALIYTDDLKPAADSLLILALKTHGLAVELLLKKPPVSLALLKELEEDIANHFEYRIQTFHQQLLLIYRTGLQFGSYYKADIQIGDTDDSKSFASQTEPRGSYAAAHSSTLPCLRLFNPQGGNQSIVFANGSSFYRTWNATVYLPEAVNIIDSALDKTSKNLNEEHTFRYLSIGLLNTASRGDLTVKQGLTYFLTNALNYVQKLQKIKTSEEDRWILATYEKVTKCYRESLSQDDRLLRALCFHSSPELEIAQTETQSSMHDLLAREMNAQRPAPAVWVLPAGQNPARFKATIEAFFSDKFPNGELSSKTAEEYVKTCLTVETVQSAVFQYLGAATDEALLLEDLTRVLQIKTQKTIHKVQLSTGALRIHGEALQAICKQYNKKEPKNMHVIVLKLIRDVSLIV